MAIILITGTSTGIGFAIAQTLAESSHTVYAAMRNPQRSQALQQLAEKENLPITILTMDVDSDESVQHAIGSVLEKEGDIDVLVNNAGLPGGSAVEETSIEVYRALMETNYLGTLRCIKMVLPSMRERRSGCIINITSVAGKLYSHFHSAYCGTKAAVEAMSESLAQEVSSYNIRIALVEPGVIETPIFTKAAPPPGTTHYPNIRRLKAFFAASLENHIQPTVVADVVKDIAEGRSTKFRNPAGPDALPLLQWRASVPDEVWIHAHDMDDETWIRSQEEHLNVRKYM